jgi:hypothetical protein
MIVDPDLNVQMINQTLGRVVGVDPLLADMRSQQRSVGSDDQDDGRRSVLSTGAKVQIQAACAK